VDANGTPKNNATKGKSDNTGKRNTIMKDLESSQEESAMAALNAWIWRQVGVPKGFENFFPKHKGGTGKGANGTKTSKGSNKGSISDKKSSSSLKDKNGGLGKNGKNSKKNKKKGLFGNSGGSNKNKGSGEEQNQAGAAVGLLLLLLAARSMLEDDSIGNGREITWSDFYNFILEPGDVDRIVVVNGKTARVYLRPGARGVPLSRMNGRTTDIPSSAGNSTVPSSRPGRNKKNSYDQWQDHTVMDMGESSTDGTHQILLHPPPQVALVLAG